jgi:hypothetical protein
MWDAINCELYFWFGINIMPRGDLIDWSLKVGKYTYQCSISLITKRKLSSCFFLNEISPVSSNCSNVHRLKQDSLISCLISTSEVQIYFYFSSNDLHVAFSLTELIFVLAADVTIVLKMY